MKQQYLFGRFTSIFESIIMDNQNFLVFFNVVEISEKRIICTLQFEIDSNIYILDFNSDSIHNLSFKIQNQIGEGDMELNQTIQIDEIKRFLRKYIQNNFELVCNAYMWKCMSIHAIDLMSKFGKIMVNNSFLDLHIDNSITLNPKFKDLFNNAEQC